MRRSLFITVLCFLLASSIARGESRDPHELVKEAVNHWRGATSYVESSMTIHRPDWQRTLAFVGWTKGEDDSLVRFTAPAKDAGNSTLVKGREMWSYSPKVNRTVKIPPSMMSQSWMGSDFSHADLSKQKDIIDRYDHTLVQTLKDDGHTVYVVESIPHEDAAVVWGKEVLRIRDDYIILERSFFDQDLILVKKLTASDIRQSGRRTYARIARMSNAEKPDEWTEVVYDKVQFDIEIRSSIFSQSNLQAAR